MKRIFIGFSCCASLLGASCISVPISALYSQTYDRCIQSAVNEYDAVRCSEAELKRADEALNNAYKIAQKHIQKFRQKDLVKVQRAWMTYRDAKCAFLYHKESGSAGLGTSSACMLDETLKRTVELKNIY